MERMIADFSTFAKRQGFALRLILIFAEMAALYPLYRARYMTAGSTLSEQFLRATPSLVKASLLTIVTTLIIRLFLTEGNSESKTLADYVPTRFVLFFNLINLVALVISAQILDYSNVQHVRFTSYTSGLFLITPIIWLGMIVSWSFVLAPVSIWWNAVREILPLILIIFLGTFASLWSLNDALAEVLRGALIEPTLFFSSFFYSLTGFKAATVGLSSDGYPIYGSNGFFVEIHAFCSGYQGILLTNFMLIVFFYICREKTTFVRVALTLFLSSISMFLLNAARIALLVYIGAHFSPTIAVNGFHENFGIVSLLLVMTIAFYLNRSTVCPEHRMIAGAPSTARSSSFDLSIDRHAHLLLPLIYLISASLAAGLLSGAFLWLYPIPILAATLGLFQIRNAWRNLGGNDVSWTSVFLGLLVFVIWIALIPPDSEKSELFRETLASAPWIISLLWLFARVIGFVVIVPIVEELAFRGAINSLLVDFQKTIFGERPAVLSSLGITSALFGLAHSHFVAGALAGLVYGLVRQRRDRLIDAIVCHGVTNMALALFVFATGNWSYWA